MCGIVFGFVSYCDRCCLLCFVIGRLQCQVGLRLIVGGSLLLHEGNYV
jgi:hypothetical protein